MRCGRITVDEGAVRKFPLDQLDGPHYSGIASGKEADDRQQEQAGIRTPGVVGLDKGISFGIESLAADILMDFVAESPPSVRIAVLLTLVHRFHGAIDSHPGHDLGMREVTPGASHFPDALVRLLPAGLQKIEQ